MSDDPAAPATRRAKPTRPGCLVRLGVWIALLVPAYFLTIPAEVTDFGPGARPVGFLVAGVGRDEATGEPHYVSLVLAALGPGWTAPTGLGFVLPQPRVTLELRDVHRVEVLEDHGDWQLVSYHYANTHSSTSVYRAYADRIEPVSYRLTSHVGQVYLAMLLAIPAWFLALLWTRLRARRGDGA